jgi:hypothetical protein
MRTQIIDIPNRHGNVLWSEVPNDVRVPFRPPPGLRQAEQCPSAVQPAFRVLKSPNDVRVRSPERCPSAVQDPRTMSECRSDPRTMSEKCRARDVSRLRQAAAIVQFSQRTVQASPVQFSQRTVQPAYRSASVLFSQRTVHQPAWPVQLQRSSQAASQGFSVLFRPATFQLSAYRSGPAFRSGQRSVQPAFHQATPNDVRVLKSLNDVRVPSPERCPSAVQDPRTECLSPSNDVLSA